MIRPRSVCFVRVIASLVDPFLTLHCTRYIYLINEPWLELERYQTVLSNTIFRASIIVGCKPVK